MSWTLIGAFGIRSNQLPTIFNQRAMAEAGGLTSYGPSFPGLFRRAAEFVDKAVRNSRSAHLSRCRAKTNHAGRKLDLNRPLLS